MSNTEKMLLKLRTSGYALWVGAGIDVYLTRGKAPTWEGFVQKLETENPNPSSRTTDLPARVKWFERCKSRAELIERVKRYIVNPVAAAVLEIGSESRLRHRAPDPWPNNADLPGEFENLARLGRLANPIVNFNYTIEASRLLREASAPMRILSMDCRDMDDSGRSREAPMLDVIHPHGVARGFGDGCMLTGGDYARQVLAFEVAVAAAYQKPLMIVGMSLDDGYLREKLARFRSEVGEIFWFRSDGEHGHDDWAKDNRVEIVRSFSWNDFWSAVERILPLPDDREDLELMVEGVVQSLEN